MDHCKTFRRGHLTHINEDLEDCIVQARMQFTDTIDTLSEYVLSCAYSNLLVKAFVKFA